MKNQKLKAAAIVAALIVLITTIFKRKELTVMVQNVNADLLTKCSNLIKQFEGFTAKSFWDNKQFTWGYGTKATVGGLIISKEKAEIELKREVQEVVNALIKLKVNLTEKQVMAFVSFGFNLGIRSMSKLLTRYKNGESMASIKASFVQYINADGKPNQGLINRRNFEAKFL